jgi:hypothetical protein
VTLLLEWPFCQSESRHKGPVYLSFATPMSSVSLTCIYDSCCRCESEAPHRGKHVKESTAKASRWFEVEGIDEETDIGVVECDCSRIDAGS